MTRLAVAISAAMLSTSMTAQQPDQPPTFRAASDVVEVDVVVQDKSGRFVTDLTPQDFVVREEGTPQPIDVFYVVNGNVRIAAHRGDSAPVATNESSAGARVTPRVFIAFFDDQHLTPGGFKRVQAAAQQLFSKHFKDGDIGGVVSGGAMVNNRLTTVREELLKAVRDAKTGAKSNARLEDERAWPRLTEIEAVHIIVHSDQSTLQFAVQRACAEDPDACGREKIDVPSLVREKARMMTDTARSSTTLTLQTLAGLLNGLSRMDGRKTVLLLSEGLLADESWPIVRQNVGLAARANARLYTLDARGLDRQGVGDRLSGVNPGTDDAMARLLNQFDMGGDSVNSLAVDTGGFVVRSQNKFDQAVEQIASDAGAYYVLGYRPVSAPDGAFRKLAVTVNRPGVSARARRGYVSTPNPVRVGTEEGRKGDGGGTEQGRSRDGAGTEGGRSGDGEGTQTRMRPDAAKHVEALSPLRVGTEQGRSGDAAGTEQGRSRDAAGTEQGRSGDGGGTERGRRREATTTADADATEGWAAYQRGDLESARASLSRSASHPAAHPWVFYALGQSHYALGHFADAATAWERVRSAAPDFKPVYFDLVDGYLQLKDYDRATRVLRDGERRWPRDAELLNALGVVQVTRGTLDDAVKSFEAAIASEPADAVGYFNLAKACELRYWKSRRFVSQTRQWIANATDRNRAIDNYKRYLELGGPLEAAARDGLSRLDWTAP